MSIAHLGLVIELVGGTSAALAGTTLSFECISARVSVLGHMLCPAFAHAPPTGRWTTGCRRAGGRWCTDGESNPSPIFACRVPVRYTDHRVQHPPPVGISPVHVHVPCVCWVGVLRKFYDPHPTAPPALPFRHVCAIGVCSTLSRVGVSHIHTPHICPPNAHKSPRPVGGEWGWVRCS